ncbi:MAG: hypothetical protein HYZ42_09935 [Bacteroidetes bacterium]|nr:hypothetical protein [Bacteroidota bacterium]
MPKKGVFPSDLFEWVEDGFDFLIASIASGYIKRSMLPTEEALNQLMFVYVSSGVSLFLYHSDSYSPSWSNSSLTCLIR